MEPNTVPEPRSKASVQYPSSGALGSAWKPWNCGYADSFKGRASGEHPNAEHWNEGGMNSVPAF
jgi:hypothetical protein